MSRLGRAGTRGRPSPKHRTYKVTITEEGQFTWPRELQRYVGLRPGDQIKIEVREDDIFFSVPRFNKLH